MKRFASQWLLCPDHTVLRNNMIEIADNDEIVQLTDLNKNTSETAGTVFLNGVIAPEIISLAVRDIPEDSISSAGKGLFRVMEGKIVEVISGAPDDFIIDFGTENLQQITTLIRNNEAMLKDISLERFIHACTYSPAAIIRKDMCIQVGACVKLSFWEHVDFLNHSLTVETRVNYL